ncbi:siderophore biosynthesis protein [Streptomyces sp. NPDC052496]|uniref:ATP-grasp domain-containing protein n=1 Tax=Streptomyces sp. NPDC052496 TaxID=3154951 RepID=UPI003448C9C2
MNEAAPPNDACAGLILLARNPTDSVTEGFLPAAARLGLAVTLLTDQPDAHQEAYERYACGRRGGGPAAAALPDGLEIVPCDVQDFRAVIARTAVRTAGIAPPAAVFTNSDHLQTQAALAAEYFGLPGKDWRAALRTKNKAELRRSLAAAGLDTVAAAELAPDDPPDGHGVPYPCVLKPREGVASEDVFLVADDAELTARCREIRTRRPGAALVLEEYLEGPLHTLETLGDGHVLHPLASFRTDISPPPHFIEERLRLLPGPPAPCTGQVLAQLRALGAGFGACHTEYVDQGGRARIVEVNDRAIGDQCDLVLAEALGLPLFELILRTHLGEPLPETLPVRRGVRVRMEYVCAGRAGVLKAAPGAHVREADGVRLDYRPLRETGERHPLYGTNRDFLGVLRATGHDEGRIDAAVREFLAAHCWEIVP